MMRPASGARPATAVRMAVSLALLLFVVVLPWLEWNATHVFNPQWPPHARLHEVWQLATNAAFGALGLALAWSRRRLAEACVLGLVMSGAFLVAWAARGVYGGSMAGTTTGALGSAGVDVAVLAMGLSAAVFAFGWRHALRRRGPPGS